MSRTFSIIAALDAAGGIGYRGGMPWHFPEEIRAFKARTSQAPINQKNAVIMGRKTYMSLPKKHRPLRRRLNLILSRSKDTFSQQEGGVYVFSSLKEALSLLETPDSKERIHQIYVIGGESVYRAAIALPTCQSLYLTHIKHTFVCDRFFPPYEDFFFAEETIKQNVENNISYEVIRYKRKVV